jgi:hypothetical protein
MPEWLSPEYVKQLLADYQLTDADAEALAAAAASLTRTVAGFPYAELRQLEPPLRSVPPSP